MPWDFALILAFLAIAVPLLGRYRVRQLIRARETTKAERLALYRSTVVFQWLIAGVIFWRARAHGVAAASLGLAIPSVTAVVALSILLSGLIFANQLLSLRRLAQEAANGQAILAQLARKIFPRDDRERLAFFGVVLTVSICEEFIFRGFAQQVFTEAGVASGIIGSAVLFAIAHLYQGRRGLFATLVVGLLFAAVRSWTGSLVAPMAAHFTADLTAGFLAPSRLGASQAAYDENKTT
jgi:membrane protease YdiL (CAAX protease family)